MGSCAKTLLIPFSAIIFALAMGSIMSSVANLSKSAITSNKQNLLQYYKKNMMTYNSNIVKP